LHSKLPAAETRLANPDFLLLPPACTLFFSSATGLCYLAQISFSITLAASKTLDKRIVHAFVELQMGVSLADPAISFDRSHHST
jgi:hypothetical protein